MTELEVIVYLCDDHISGEYSATQIDNPDKRPCSVLRCNAKGAFIAAVVVK